MVTQEQLERKIQERPSSLDRGRLCPASLFPDKDEVLIEVVGDDDYSPIGQGAHDVFKAIAKDEKYTLEEVAIDHGVKVSDLEYLKYTAYKCVDILNQSFDVETWQAEEEQISIDVGDDDIDYPLKGTPDLSGITRDGKTLIVADYKTGVSTASHKHQIQAYCHILLSKAPATVENVVGVILWARDLEAQPWRWTRKDIQEWVKETKGIIYGWDGVSYAVGEHCTYCRRSECKARRVKMKEMYDLIATQDDDEVVTLGAGMPFPMMYEASKAIPKIIDSWRKRVKEQIKITGDLPLGDGKVLTLKERNGASVIHTKKAAKVLDEFDFSVDDFLGCCKASKTSIETVVGDRAEKGMKGKDKKKVIEALKQAGALIQPTVSVLSVVDKPKEVTNGK